MAVALLNLLKWGCKICAGKIYILKIENEINFAFLGEIDVNFRG